MSETTREIRAQNVGALGHLLGLSRQSTAGPSHSSFTPSCSDSTHVCVVVCLVSLSPCSSLRSPHSLHPATATAGATTATLTLPNMRWWIPVFAHPEAEIKAEDAANVPKRRSIFRTTGTASTPDLSTLIRGKKQQQPRQDAKQREASTSSSKSMSHAGAPNSAADVGTHLRSHLTSSTSSLTRRNELGPPQSTNTWAMHRHHTNDSQRQMTTIAESPIIRGMSDAGRHASFDEGAKVSLDPCRVSCMIVLC